MLTDLEISKLWLEALKFAKTKINICYHPDCNEKSINSHILQRNGILNHISKNSHVWEKKVNQYSEKKFYFKEEGLKKVFSFNCFCNEHDKNLFKKIEDNVIDFQDYESCLLFTLRTLYNEIYRKQIIIEQIKYLMKTEKSSELNLEFLLSFMYQQTLGIGDLQKNEYDIWEDINKGTQNFVFQMREMTKIGICLSAFFNYETTLEMMDYILRKGEDMERISAVFINFFPYNNKSVLLMGYNKKDEKKLKPYVNRFFKESESRTETQITNLLIFACETWIISEELYKSKIEKVEDIFIAAISYSIRNNNERQFFKVNIFRNNFCNDMQTIKRYIC